MLPPFARLHSSRAAAFVLTRFDALHSLARQAIVFPRQVSTAPRRSLSVTKSRADRLEEVRHVGMFQRKIINPERGAEFLAGQIGVDQAEIEGEVVLQACSSI